MAYLLLTLCYRRVIIFPILEILPVKIYAMGVLLTLSCCIFYVNRAFSELATLAILTYLLSLCFSL